MKTLTLRRHTMNNLLVRTHTFTMLTSRLVAIALFAALLSAAPSHAGVVLGGVWRTLPSWGARR